MKKLLLSLLVLTPATSLMADMRFDLGSKRFYSTPADPSINQNDYHGFCEKYFQVIHAWYSQYGFNTNYSIAAKNDLEQRLRAYFAIIDVQRLCNPNLYYTMLRFIADVGLLNLTGGFSTLFT